MDTTPNNLPAELTSFIGRERELVEAKALLRAHRLLTLTGPGGGGKTRLAIQLARDVAAEFPDGVYFVPLGPVGDPGLVAPSIAQTVAVTAAGHTSLMDRLVGYLRERQVLLVLDNFEHLLAGASVVVELLRATGAPRILVTSRSPLHVSGEQEYPVPPLDVPDPPAQASLAAIAHCESVRLFAERASAAVPGFAVDATNVGAVSQIVGRLDGLPLAIELAAARVKLLSPEAILARLRQSLTLLVGGARDVPDRQRTLRATIAWSYGLLSDPTQQLLAACSVFRGGASLETIEAVCEPTVAFPTLDGLQELADHSLLRRVPGQPEVRYSMLEVLDTMDLVERFLERGQVVRRFRMYTDGKPLVNLDLSRIGSRYGCMLGIPQDETEALLRRRVVELGGRIEQAVELLSVCEHDGVVTATVKDAAGQTHTITSSYLVGCDGAHSRVRHELGLSFHGHPYAEDWLLADVRMDWDRREDEFHAFFRAHGSPMVCLPLRDHGWRIILPYAGERGQDAPTFDEVQRLVDERAPQPVALSDPTWLTTFRCHRRSTNVYRVGSVLLAGDAVHIHTPAGGQGMNTGILDAHNLAWKLALVASGRSPAALLDTYGEERGPVAAEVLQLTHALVTFSTVTGPVKRAVRDTLTPVVSRIPAVQRRTVRRMSHHHVAYRNSRLTRRDRRPGGPKPGERAADVEVAGIGGGATRRLHQVLGGGRHVLVVPAGQALGTAARQALRTYEDVEVVVGRLDGVKRIAARRPGTVYLVRPDGYIAARGTTERLPRVLDYLGQLDGRRRLPVRHTY